MFYKVHCTNWIQDSYCLSTLWEHNYKLRTNVFFWGGAFRTFGRQYLGTCTSKKINQCCHSTPRIQRFLGLVPLSQWQVKHFLTSGTRGWRWETGERPWQAQAMFIPPGDNYLTFSFFTEWENAPPPILCDREAVLVDVFELQGSNTHNSLSNQCLCIPATAVSERERGTTRFLRGKARGTMAPFPAPLSARRTTGSQAKANFFKKMYLEH